jgi:succinoglycan biosynthesis transport protein ExoP
MRFTQFLGILRARSWLIATVFAAVLALVTAASMLMTPRYTATAQLLIDVKSPDPVAGAVLPAHLLNSYIATQVELLTSEKVALQVVDTLKLAERSEWTSRLSGDPRAASPATSPDAVRQALATALLRDLKVRPAKDSNLLVVSYSSRDRQSVAAVANEFVRAYVDTTIRMRVEPAQKTREFFVEQSKQYRDVLLKAQAKLTDFRQRSGIATTDEVTDIDNVRLRDLSAQLTTLQAARIEAARRRDAANSALQAGAGDVTEVLGSPLIQSLKGQLALAEARLRERSAVLGANHPEIARTQEEVASLTARLRTETASITGSLERSYQVAAQRESEVKSELDRQRGLVMGGKNAREQLAVLQRDVDSAQRAYDALVTRVTQASLESQATQANVTPITTATMPVLPSSPNIPLNLSIGVVFGALLGVISALLAEAASGRVRVAEDLERVTGAPVIGELSPVPARIVGPTRRVAALPRKEPAKLGVAPSAARAASQPSAPPGGPSPGAASPMPGSPEVAVAGAPDAAAEEGVAEALLDAGLLSASDVERIATVATAQGVRFSEAAVASGKVSAEQVKLALSVRTEFPLLDPSQSKLAKEVIAAFDADHPFMDDLRMLRTRIKAQLETAGPEGSRVVAIVSQGPREGRSFSAANLAVSFAQMGDRTLLIDADMRTGRQHELFSLSNALGLSSVLSQQCKPRDALQRVPGLGDLTVLTAGPEVPSPSDLLARNATARLLKLMSNAFDVVIVDTPSAGSKPDASLIVAAARNYVIVARRDRSLASGVEKLSQSLGQLGARMIGSVLVKA